MNSNMLRKLPFLQVKHRISSIPREVCLNIPACVRKVYETIYKTGAAVSKLISQYGSRYG